MRSGLVRSGAVMSSDVIGEVLEVCQKWCEKWSCDELGCDTESVRRARTRNCKERMH